MILIPAVSYYWVKHSEGHSTTSSNITKTNAEIMLREKLKVINENLPAGTQGDAFYCCLIHSMAAISHIVVYSYYGDEPCPDYVFNKVVEAFPHLRVIKGNWADTRNNH